MESMWEINGRQGDKEDYEYYVHLLLNTADLAQSAQFGVDLGLGHLDDNGVYVNTFDINNYLSEWNGINFGLSC